MNEISNKAILAGALLKNARMIRLRPSVNIFMLKYIRKFKLVNVGGNLIIHSHLPAINSKAYSRFVNEHLLEQTPGPSHAQIGLTNLCPQNCAYCYNRERAGVLLDTDRIIQTIRELKAMGVVWIGLTGGEPLFDPDIVEIVKSAGDDCAIKLFTTGSGLTEKLAKDLRSAGLLYVSVSLDDRSEVAHDRARGCAGAFRTALNAIKIFRKAGFHVSVSSVISNEMIREGTLADFLEFLENLNIHEAWLSEAKPTAAAYWNPDAVITEKDRLTLVRIQDIYNKRGRMTVNYLGHFEGREHFGCNAGSKMVYVDAFGEVSPCVFTPMTYGNVRERPLKEIVDDMRLLWPPQGDCWINKNYMLVKKYYKGRPPICREDSITMMQEAKIGPPSEFTCLSSGR